MLKCYADAHSYVQEWDLNPAADGAGRSAVCENASDWVAPQLNQSGTLLVATTDYHTLPTTHSTQGTHIFMPLPTLDSEVPY